MAFTALTPGIIAVESADAKSIQVWDSSLWNGESGLCSAAKIQISYYDPDEALIELDPYDLFEGGATRFNEFLDRVDGHKILVSDLKIDGVAIGDRLTDAHYLITVYFSDGSYGVYPTEWPYATIHRGFLAKYDFMARKMPYSILTWPMTNAVRIANNDIFLLRMYLDAAKDSAEYNKFDEFRVLINLIAGVLDYYEISEAW